MEDAREESKRAAAETERLLQLVQMSQEEQNSKEKTIMDLQQYEKQQQLFNRIIHEFFFSFYSIFRALKNAQAKLKAQQQAQAEVS